MFSTRGGTKAQNEIILSTWKNFFLRKPLMKGNKLCAHSTTNDSPKFETFNHSSNY